MTQYRLFPSTNGPAAGTATAATPFQSGMIFQVTQNALWLNGIYYWCAASGQSTGAITVALWQPTAAATFFLVANSSASLASLTAGAWNFVPLPAPIGLSASVPYVAVTAYSSTTGFADTGSQFGAAQPFAAGITNGPLMAYSDTGGSAPAPNSQTQGLFGTGAASSGNANANYPSSGSSGSSNFWVDVQVDSVAPASPPLRLWPSQPFPVNSTNDTPQQNWTLATEFNLSAAATLNRIWFYSPSGATQLPTDTGIWLVSSQSLVAGTHLVSPTWSGAAGSGWVSTSYTGVVLQAGDYKVSVYNGGSIANPWNNATITYWAAPGAGQSGITNGILSAPNNATATSPGQGTFIQAAGPSFAYPNTTASSSSYWVDVDVTPQPPPAGTPPIQSNASGDVYGWVWQQGWLKRRQTV